MTGMDWNPGSQGLARGQGSWHASQGPLSPPAMLQMAGGWGGTGEPSSPPTLPGGTHGSMGTLLSWCHSSVCRAWGPSKWKLIGHGHIAV